MLRRATALLIALIFGSLAHAQESKVDASKVKLYLHICEQEFNLCQNDGERADTAEELMRLCKYERDGCVRAAKHGVHSER
jgi:hypothetical protein